MAGKRGATSDLNHDNWNVEDDKEEMGSFQMAAPETLQSRIIKTARRRNADGDKTPTSSVFSGFSGFANKSLSSTPITASSFSFLSNLTNGKIETTKTNGSSIFGNKVEPPKSKEPISEDTKDNTASTQEKPDEYYAKLKGLNQSVTQWIKSNVDENPFCILTPIFQDYEKYLKEIESISAAPSPKVPPKPQLESAAKSTIATPAATTFQQPTFNLTSKPETKPLFSFNPNSSKSPFESLADKPNFNFGSSATPTASPQKTFSFGGGKPFTIPAPQNTDTSVTKTEDDDNEDDTPPKTTFTPVVEENSLYSKRCKVFVKKNGNYSDRGTGTLFIKPVENSDKRQLVVRADTSLGNLLLNLILSDSMPLQRMGKNNVMMVCIPNPEVQPPPVPILLRVKTTEEADELYETLTKFKK